ncbi:MAG: hypothetical protein ABI718_00305 [Acidobacteriota bacterium]
MRGYRRRGALADLVTQQWVRWTGRNIDPARTSWLSGPIGDPSGIGRDFFIGLASSEGLQVRRSGGTRGLLAMKQLRGPGFDPAEVAPAVRDFYEHTSDFELDSWAEWCGVFRPFGWLLTVMFSRRLQQLNMPLRPLDTSGGTVSEIIHLQDPASGEVMYTAWLRELRRTGNVLYAGCYSTAGVPGYQSPCVKVVFPLPNGNAIVLLRPSVGEDGALTILSSGRRFGDPGFYFTVRDPEGTVRARYVRTMREKIRVYADGNGAVRADHTLAIWGTVFLRLHYKCTRRQQTPASQDG